MCVSSLAEGERGYAHRAYLWYSIDGDCQEENHEAFDQHHGHEVWEMERREHTFLRGKVVDMVRWKKEES